MSIQPHPAVLENSTATSASVFVLKTYEIVSDQSTNDIVSFSESGNSFIIHKASEFGSCILSRYFKSSSLESFVRQLHTYVRSIKKIPFFVSFFLATLETRSR